MKQGTLLLAQSEAPQRSLLLPLAEPRLRATGARESAERQRSGRSGVVDRLLEVDWSFKTSNTRSGTHGIHPYPAKFIPQIPRTLISLLHPADGSAVLDPFCGSGTTLVEAMIAGLPSIGIDLSPIAALISKVKTRRLTGQALPEAHRIVRLVAQGSYNVPDIPRCDHWFKPDVQSALAGLTTEIAAVADETVRDLLNVALSSIIVRVSNQESDTRYAAIERSVSKTDVLTYFERAVASVEHAVRESFPELLSIGPAPHILQRDILTVEPRELGRNIGLAITSPPYPNAYEYWLYHKYRMYWLGMDPIAVRESEIGARPHYHRTNPQTEVEFEAQMTRCFWLLSKVLSVGAYACFLVGRSIIRGRFIDNVELLTRAAEPAGFVRIVALPRALPVTRRAFNPSHATKDGEHILVLRLTT